MARKSNKSVTTSPRFAIGDTVEVQIADTTNDMHGAIGTVARVEGGTVYVMFEGYADSGFEPDGFYACDLGKV
jgi:hypothetical protein